MTAIWLLPTNRTYGDWPRSGEIDLVEARGNREYRNNKGEHIGVEHFGSTLHFGPRWDQNAYWAANFVTRSAAGDGFNKGFHSYRMDWSPDGIVFYVDGREIGRTPVGDGFWAKGKFGGDNIWEMGTNGMAPFDQEVISFDFFHLFSFIIFEILRINSTSSKLSRFDIEILNLRTFSQKKCF